MLLLFAYLDYLSRTKKGTRPRVPFGYNPLNYELFSGSGTCADEVVKCAKCGVLKVS
ncbi:TPA: hypothetical protein ACS7Z1_000645 [Providencia alcalifaciens]